MNSPLLTVCIITYNHESFIRQAIDGVLMQRVNFKWEIIIADDCSTDNTRKILLEYKEKYPDLITLLLQPKNIGPAKNWLELISAPKGKYLSFCDGDDYWTDPLKLQKQVDFLELNQNYDLCFHQNFQLVDEKIIETNDLFLNRDRKANELLWGGIILNTVVLRKKAIDYSKFTGVFFDVQMGDVYLLCMLAQHSGAKFLSEIRPSVYRFHSGGTWSSMTIAQKLKRRISNYLLTEEISGLHVKTHNFILMNFYLDLVIVEAKSKHVFSAFLAYLHAARFSLKSLWGVKWFFLFHARIRYKKYIVNKIKAQLG